MRALLLAALLSAAAPAWAQDPPKDSGFGGIVKGAVPRSYDLAPARVVPRPSTPVEGNAILVERYKALPSARPPEPEQRDVFENDPSVRSSLNDRQATTRSGSRDGCHAGTVCYGDAPTLRDRIGSLFGG